jgi:D-arabinose 1-dehydrogenase-like Zn-dependent alcohol dehydrogenase
VNCANLKVTGFSYDGGYQEYMIAPVEAVARMPESLDPAEAAPLLCAGITTFNALRHSGAVPSDLVAVQGIGGLGHLGIQFAQKFGYRVAAIGAGQKMRGSRRSWERASTSTVSRRTQRQSCRNSAGHEPGDGAQLESDVVPDRRTRGERQDDGGRGVDGPDRGDTSSVDFGQPERSGQGVGNPDRLGGYAAVCRADRCR